VTLLLVALATALTYGLEIIATSVRSALTRKNHVQRAATTFSISPIARVTAQLGMIAVRMLSLLAAIPSTVAAAVAETSGSVPTVLFARNNSKALLIVQVALTGILAVRRIACFHVALLPIVTAEH